MYKIYLITRQLERQTRISFLFILVKMLYISKGEEISADCPILPWIVHMGGGGRSVLQDLKSIKLVNYYNNWKKPG